MATPRPHLPALKQCSNLVTRLPSLCGGATLLQLHHCTFAAVHQLCNTGPSLAALAPSVDEPSSALHGVACRWRSWSLCSSCRTRTSLGTWGPSCPKVRTRACTQTRACAHTQHTHTQAHTTHLHARTRAHTHSHLCTLEAHARMHQACTHMRINTCTHTHTCSHAHARTHVCKRTQTHVHAHTCTRINKKVHPGAHTYAHIHTHAHAHIHTTPHTRACT